MQMDQQGRTSDKISCTMNDTFPKVIKEKNSNGAIRQYRLLEYTVYTTEICKYLRDE
jgi:hypothetical protein